MTENINDRWLRFIGNLFGELEPTLQQLLNEYPTGALERMLVWARYRWLAHDWQACLNAAAVGHPIAGPDDVETELGVPAAIARRLAAIWDAHAPGDPTHGVIAELISELTESRSRRGDSATELPGRQRTERSSAHRPDRFRQPI